jgi:hypothetical protein
MDIKLPRKEDAVNGCTSVLWDKSYTFIACTLLHGAAYNWLPREVACGIERG